MMELTAKLFKKIDFVGAPVKLTFQGKNSVSSVIGGFLSIVVIVLVTLGFGYFGMQIISRDKPLMNSIQERTEDAKVAWKDNPFFLVVLDKYAQDVTKNPSFIRAFNISIEYAILSTSDTKFTISYYRGSMKHCSESDFSQRIWEDLNSLEYHLSTSLCVDEESFVDAEGKRFNQELYLKNRYGYRNSTFVRFRVKLCDETADPGCRDYAKEQGYFSVVAIGPNYYEEQSNYEQPVKPQFESVPSFISPDFHQVKYVYSKINKIVTDSSLFLSDTSTSSYSSIASVQNSLAGYDANDRTIYQLIFSMDQIVNNNQRRYLKIPELLANMGGLIKGMMIISHLFIYIYSEFVLCKEIGLFIYSKTDRVSGSTVRFNQRNLSNSHNSATVNFAKKPSTEVKQLSLWSFIKASFKFWKINQFKKERFKYLEVEFIIRALSFVEDQMKENSRPNRD